MNTIITIIIATLLTLFAPTSAMASSKVSASNRAATEKSITLDLSAVHTIRASQGVEVQIVEATPTMQITIEASEKSIDKVEVELNGKVLNISISFPKTRTFDSDIVVKVPYNGLFNSFIASSAAEINSKEYLRASSLTLEATSAAEVSLIAIVEGDCTIESSSAAEVELVAKIVGSCSVDAASAAEVDLTISAAELIVMGTSSADIDAEGAVDKLDVSLTTAASFDGGSLESQRGTLKSSSGASLKYRGTDDFKEQTSKGGSIKRVK